MPTHSLLTPNTPPHPLYRKVVPEWHILYSVLYDTPWKTEKQVDQIPATVVFTEAAQRICLYVDCRYRQTYVQFHFRKFRYVFVKVLLTTFSRWCGCHVITCPIQKCDLIQTNFRQRLSPLFTVCFMANKTKQIISEDCQYRK